MPRLIKVQLDLKIPGLGGIQGTWEPDEAEATAAWELYVEMVTRTPLGDSSPSGGSAREALNSIYSLFDTTRGILRNHGPSVARPKRGWKLSFGYLAVSILNLVLRPLLSEWHPRLLVWECQHTEPGDDGWPDLDEFRQDLSLTRQQLLQYAGLFAQVAEVPELMVELDGTDSTA